MLAFCIRVLQVSSGKKEKEEIKKKTMSEALNVSNGTCACRHAERGDTICSVITLLFAGANASQSPNSPDVDKRKNEYVS